MVHPAVVFALSLLGLVGGAYGLLYRPDLPAAPLERAYAGEGSRFIEVAGMRFHYRDEGEGDVLLLLHGMTANLFAWDAWAERLSGHFRVIRLDLPGHGLTGPDPERRYGWSELAELVMGFLDTLEVGRATLVGNSLGGTIAWQIAGRHPTRIERLILVAPVGYTAGGRLPLLLRLLAHPVSGPLLAPLTPRRAFIKRVRSTYGDPARVDEDAALRQYRLFRRTGNRQALGPILRGGNTLETEAALGRIQAPTLILWGARDPVLPPEHAQRFAGDIEDADVVMIPGAGHMPMLEMPDASAAALLHFLARTTPLRAGL